MIVDVQCAATSTSLSGFLSKFDVMVAKVLEWASCPGWYPLTSKRGDFVDSFYTNVNISGSFSMNAYKSLSLSNFSLTDYNIAFLHKSSGLIECCSGTFSSVTFVEDGGGGIDTRLTMSSGVDVWLSLVDPVVLLSRQIFGTGFQPAPYLLQNILLCRWS